MIKIRKTLYSASSVGLILALTQCSDIDVRERNSPIARLAKPNQRSAQSMDRQYDEAYKGIIQARKKEKHAPGEAMSLYLNAAKIAYQSRNEELLPLYNHAVGQVVDLLVLLKGTRKGSASRLDDGLDKKNKLHIPTARRGEFSMLNIDDVQPTDCLKYKGWRTDTKQEGVGAPIVVHRLKENVSGVDQQFTGSAGQSYAATAMIKFSSSGASTTAELRFYNPTKKDRVDFWGESRMLANDLTSPFAVLTHEGSDSRQEILLKWFGVFTPMNYIDQMGLYMIAPFDPEKIPVVLVHGLKSDPLTWRNVINELNGDPELRKKYQFSVFYYPTGLPLRVPSAALKKEINKLHGHYQKSGMKKNAEQMVIVGHSLGGLLTSVQVRKIDSGLLDKIFKTPVKEADVNELAVKDYQYIIGGPRPDFVKRAVFIATPHRGSSSADIYIARLLASLVDIPKNVLFLQVPATTAALTDFGRTLFGADEQQNSLSVLKSRSATLSLITDSPFYKHIKYHSIMGDRGRGDTPKSSDGVVAYESSHLDGAESEKIVPTKHNAHDSPEAIQEIRRILRLNLHEK